jgi:hypothetical protein
MTRSVFRIGSLSVVIATMLIGISAGCSSQHGAHRRSEARRVEGDGVVVRLPHDWEAAADVVSLTAPVGEHAWALRNYFAEVAKNDQYVRLIGYDGTRTVIIQASPLLLDQIDVEGVVGDFIDIQDSKGWEFVSREAISIDGNEAVALTMDHPSSQARELDVLWIEGDQGWVSAWTTTRDDFEAAKPVFDGAISTVRTESGDFLP